MYFGTINFSDDKQIGAKGEKKNTQLSTFKIDEQQHKKDVKRRTVGLQFNYIKSEKGNFAERRKKM